MLVYADGRIVGTIGGGCYENDAFWKAREAITKRKPELVHYELSDDFAQETGLVCGGQMDVYIEPIEPSPELYIVGAGHVAFNSRASREKSASGFTSPTTARSSPMPSASRPPWRLSWTTSRHGSRERTSRLTHTS